MKPRLKARNAVSVVDAGDGLFRILDAFGMGEGGVRHHEHRAVRLVETNERIGVDPLPFTEATEFVRNSEPPLRQEPESLNQVEISPLFVQRQARHIVGRTC